MIGDPRIGGDPDINDFIEKMKALKTALAHTERLITKTEKTVVHFKLSEATHDSPWTFVLLAYLVTIFQPNKFINNDLCDVLIKRFNNSVKAINKGTISKDELDLPAWDAYMKMGESNNERNTGFEVLDGTNIYSVDRTYVQKIKNILGKEEVVYGSIVGKVEGYNSHNDNNTFFLYPIVGLSRVTCYFPDKLKYEAKESLLKNVRVHGKLKYKPGDNFPSEVIVDNIEFIDENPESTLMSLRGIVKTTGKLKSEEIIRRGRHAY